MLLSVLYFIPSIVCILWFVSYLFKVKTQRQKLFMWMLAIEAFYFTTLAVYISPHTDYLLMVKMDAVCVPLILALMAMTVLNLTLLRYKRKLRVTDVFYFVPAMVMGIVVNLLYYLLGFENTARYAEALDTMQQIPAEFKTDLYNLYYLFDETLVNIISAIFVVVVLYMCYNLSRSEGYHFGDAYRFFFKGHRSTPARAISLLTVVMMLLLIPIIGLGRGYIMQHPVLGATLMCLLAVVNHLVCHVDINSGEEGSVTLRSLSHIQERKNYSNFIKTPVTTTSKEPTHSHKDVEALHSVKIEALVQRMKKALEEDRVYCQDDLTLTSFCEYLNVGKTTASTVINHQYGMPFRDLVNLYRIDAAKAYMLKNPTATQEEIAMVCGFKDASSLSKKFKEAEGTTPLLWLTQQGK